MKKFVCGILAAITFCLMAGCQNPNSLQLDLSRGYGEHLKLLHLNASTGEKKERMEAFRAVLENSSPLDKEFSMFAYYPDYLLTVTDAKEGTVIAIVDINGDFVDFYYPSAEDGSNSVIYRSKTTAKEFRKLVHTVDTAG